MFSTGETRRPFAVLERQQVGDPDRRRRADAAAVKVARDDADEARAQDVATLQGQGGAAGVVAPVVLATAGDVVEREHHLTGEVEAAEPDLARAGRGEGQEDVPVEGHRRDRAALVVDVGTQGADPIGGPRDVDLIRRDAEAPDDLAAERLDP